MSEGKTPRDSRQYLPGGPEQFLARSAMATFADLDTARRARRELQQQGFEMVQIDEISWRSSERGDRRDAPFPHTLTGVPGDAGKRSMAAMDPSISGFAEGFGNVTGEHRYLMTVAVEDQDSLDRAAKIIRENGGDLDRGGPV